ncbi:MAG TPA: glycoside hydrolase family 3 N-terminal domain-containing protein [Ilumatobacteraceae bacterium]|nr:glycoside hydrolase family 3 N-terminal domain-containing protein [Ilumatobacteraceae bacterium]
MPSVFIDAVARVRAGIDHHDAARSLVGSMTLDEKLGCLDGDTPMWPGLFDMTAGGYYEHPWPAAKVERLGLPGIDFADGPRGCVVGDATAFPVSMARGASFDPDLEQRIGRVIGAELRASGATYTGAVCMNLLRHPAWGRAQETYGEDPHHVGRMAAALTRGLQQHVMACMKHFALNSMENARFRVDVTVDERALHEVYLPHFRHVAAEGIASVMSAYNSVNGQWCGENAILLTGILRDEWGWDGFVTSDFIFGLRDAVTSVQAGLDIEMPFRQQREMCLAEAIESGDLAVADVDDAVERIVSTLLRFAYVYESRPALSVVGSEAHRALAREAAAASMVLVRNEGDLLPVDPNTIGRVAVLGRLAAVPNLGDGGSSDVRASKIVTPLDGLRAEFDDVVHADSDVSIVDGADLVVVVVGYTKDDEGEYIDNEGTGALVADLFPDMDHPTLGRNAPYQRPAPTGRINQASATDSPSGMMAPGGDRVSLRLSAADEALIAAASARHRNVVVAVMCGSAVLMPWVESVSSTLVIWYPGVEGGTALADVVSGRAEPGGRLPFAIPTDLDHLVAFDRNATAVTYDLFHGQWKLDRDRNPAQFPFGWGLGYGSAMVDATHLIDAGRSVQVELSNGSDRATSTVVFVHAGLDESEHERPARRLVGFGRVDVAAGERSSIVIDLDWSMLDLRLDGAWVTEAGSYSVDVGRFANDPAAHHLAIERG